MEKSIRAAFDFRCRSMGAGSIAVFLTPVSLLDAFPHPKSEGTGEKSGALFIVCASA
jgi:hypothetical protein